jgi:3-oxoacyl-[acyl-carrier protein] reductase
MTALDLTRCKVGDRAELDVVVDEALVDAFADFSGDRNPLHVDAGYAKTTRFKRRVAHGMSYASLFSRLIGMDLPGPGALWMSQSFRFESPAFVGDRLRLSVEIRSISESARTITLDCRAVNQMGDEITSGTGEVMVLETDEPDTRAQTSESRVAIVTGASRGIGAGVAARLAQDGVALALTYRSSRQEAEAACASFDNAICVEADSADPAAMKRLYDEVAARLGPPNLLVLNASGRDLYGEAGDGDFDRFERHLAGQLVGPHALVSAALDGMIANGGGSIIALGSAYAHGAPPAGMAPYVVAKAALAAYVRCLAVDYGPKGIRANLVAPGMTETSLLSGVPDRARKVAAMQNPMRRLAVPDDVAGAVAYLASPDAAYVNGQTLVVSGGSLML